MKSKIVFLASLALLGIAACSLEGGAVSLITAAVMAVVGGAGALLTLKKTGWTE